MNAVIYIQSLKGNSFSDIVSRGINQKKNLDERQQKIVSDMMSAAQSKDVAEKLNGYEATLLAMHLITFVNTL